MLPTKRAQDQEGPCLIFLHIPKAGGQTLRAILIRMHPPERRFVYRGPLGGSWEEEPDWPSLQLITGHLHYGIHAQLPGPAAYITLVRDPVERIVSLHDYISRNPQHELHEVVRDMTITDFLDADVAHEHVVNGQTRQLAGLASSDPTAADLERAKCHLDTFLVAADVRDITGLLVLLRRARGWPIPFFSSRNVSHRERAALPDGVRHQILQRNELDVDLHRHVRENFRAAFAAMGPGARVETRLLRVVNQMTRIMAFGADGSRPPTAGAASDTSPGP